MEPHKKINQPTIVFIFGGSGDLNKRKLTPALYNLFADDHLPEMFLVVGLGRTDYSDTSFRNYLLKNLKTFSRRKVDAKLWKEFSQKIAYLDFDANVKNDYNKIGKLIEATEKKWKAAPNVLFYMAVSPAIVPPIITSLSRLNICKQKNCSRIVVEKPFGHDLESARALNKLLLTYFDERQIYRIDHFLGKETVQNILALRFANALFEPIWNKRYIDYVQITAAESIGIEDRGDYYDKAGALRDMVQNHIIQLLCMIATEPPVSFEDNEVRNKKMDVLNAIRKIKKEEVSRYAVRGQYAGGWMKGKKVKSYLEEKHVAENSSTETFAAIKFYIDNWRWQNVPFYVRTGKYLPDKSTLIIIKFKEAPKFSFPAQATDNWKANKLIIRIQPEMDIRITFQAKIPGQEMLLAPVDMIFDYDESFKEAQSEAYETLLLDAMTGDATQFMRGDQVEKAWEIIMPVLDYWAEKKATDFPNYLPGSWGPDQSDALIATDGRNWDLVIPNNNAHADNRSKK